MKHDEHGVYLMYKHRNGWKEKQVQMAELQLTMTVHDEFMPSYSPQRLLLHSKHTTSHIQSTKLMGVKTWCMMS